MKRYLRTVILLVGLTASISGCATYQNLKPEDKNDADVGIQLVVGMILDQNPNYKPIVKQIVTDGLAVLDGTNLVTRDGVITWITTQINSKLDKSNPRIQLFMSVLLNRYLPHWDSTTAPIIPITSSDRDTLKHLAALILQVTN